MTDEAAAPSAAPAPAAAAAVAAVAAVDVRIPDRDCAAPARTLLLCSSEDGGVVAWDLHSQVLVRRLHAQGDSVLALGVHPNRRVFATGGMERDAAVRVWVVDA